MEHRSGNCEKSILLYIDSAVQKIGYSNLLLQIFNLTASIPNTDANESEGSKVAGGVDELSIRFSLYSVTSCLYRRCMGISLQMPSPAARPTHLKPGWKKGRGPRRKEKIKVKKGSRVHDGREREEEL